MSSATQTAAGSPVRILSLDGGGVRGLSSLLILEGIMECIQQLKHLPEVPKPCDKFDFIGGTGTGGIIAIMLGRLRMSVHEAIQAYKHLADTVFVPEPTPTTTSSSAFSATKLEMAIKEMIRNNCCDPQCAQLRESDSPGSETSICLHEDMLFLDEHCTKTAVLAMTKVNVETSPTLLKSYPSSECFRGCKVWEVARATSAAVTFFDSIKLGRDQIEFIGASYGYNNPCEQLIAEATAQFPGRQMTVLSIGTGLGDVVEITDLRSSVLKAMSKMVSSSKDTDLRLQDRHSGTGVYHRFNVVNGLRETGISDRDKWSRIAAHTINYLRENKELVKNYVTAFTTSGVPQPQICHDGEDKKCLSAFCVTDPSADKKGIESKKGGLLKDCYQWIVDHEDFQRFLKEEESGILWIKGDPGKGKTMLLCGIIDTLALDYSVDVSYFFCQATSNELKTATSVLRTLIHDLARRNPQLTKHLREKYDFMGTSFFRSDSLWYNLCDILTDLLNDPSLRNPILIVDALDECSVGLQDLLKFIAKPSSAKWIVSSRNWPEIEETLNNAEQQKVKIRLEINQHSVSKAVDWYIAFKVDQLTTQKKYDSELKRNILEHLQSNANGTFLWIALVVQELSNAQLKNWDALSKLRSLPPGLYPLYGRMMDQISASPNADLCKEIIATALVVYRPITLEEIHGLVEAPEGLKMDNINEIIALCGSFLTTHNNVVSFVHQSAKDYFLSEGSHEMMTPERQHGRIFLRSLNVLRQKLERDIYGLQAPGCLIDEVSVPEIDPLAAIRYPCTFWVDHLCDSAEAEAGIASKSDEVLAFITDKYLQWLEALSLLKNISAAGRGMERLRLYFGESSKGLNDIIMDARRFLLFHGEAIEIAPLQVYASALIFSPTNSLIRKMFHHEEPDWIAIKPRVEESWSACLRTLVGHNRQVISVVFSNDGQRLASASYDRTVKIWDATSGACLQTLEGHEDGVRSAVFSNDGQRLASGSDDKTVKIWNATSGACLQTLEGHHDSVLSVVFSNEAQRLASASYDRTVKIWDVTSGACLHTLVGHQHYVASVVFSNDGQRLASGSEDKTVKIWDATSGGCLQTLEGHDEEVTSVVFLNNRKRLESESRGHAVKIWDSTSGACLQTLIGHNQEVMSVVFSNDGQRLASGSWDMTVKIWDATSGACLQTLEGHDSKVTSLVFSIDGKRLASASNGKTVKIWDATSGACLQTLKGHDHFIASVVFSNDGRRLASGSWDKTVKIWDATSGTCLYTLEGHDECVTSAVFSNDGQRLASGSWDKTVKIWDATSGACLQTLKGHNGTVTSVVFSNDGQRLASGSYDRTVKIWDATSGARLQTLEGHDSKVTSLVFSIDGKRLASASNDKTVKIWDATSGACLQTLKGHDHCIASVVFSNDAQRLASGYNVKIVKIWDATSGACLQSLEGHDPYVASAVCSNDGQRLASRSHDNTVKIWDATSGTSLQNLAGHDRWVISAVFSNDGQRLASGSYDKTIKIWNATSGACLQTLEGRENDMTSMVFSNDGQRLASGFYDNTVKIWDATSGAYLQTLVGRDDDVTSMVFSNDGQRLVTMSLDKTIKIWDATSGAYLQTLVGRDDDVTSVVFSINGKRLASGSYDKTVKIWDATSGACLQTLEGHDHWATLVVFSNNGHRLASGSYDKTLKIWDAASGACLQTLKGHDRWVISAVFSNDGQRLASGSRDKTVKIWDATSGACLKTLVGHHDSVTSAVFSNDGQRLASGSREKTVKIWDAISGTCLQTLPPVNTCYCSFTDVGLLELGFRTPSIIQTALNTLHFYSYTVGTNDTWVLKDGQRVLYLPPSYRPLIPAAVACQNLALVLSSRRVIVIGFR